MSDLHCISSKIHHGVWRGVFDGAVEQPAIEVRLLDRVVPDVSISQQDTQWLVEVPIPEDAISDGVHNFAVFNTADGQAVADFTLIAGEPLSADIRAEVDLLRAELDMLKRAFRRHCVETT